MRNRIIPILLMTLAIWGCSKEPETNVDPNNMQYPIVYYNLQTDDWEYLICNETEQLLIYKESDTGFVAYGINNPSDSNGFFFISNDSLVSITSNTFDLNIVMKEDSVMVIINDGENSYFYKYDYYSIFSTQNSKRSKIGNSDVLSSLFSETIKGVLKSFPTVNMLYSIIDMVGTLRELDDVDSHNYLDWLEHRNHRYDNIFKWAKDHEYEHKSNPTIIAGISTGGSRVEGTTAYCLVDGFINLQADIYYTGTLSVNYGICYSKSPNPTINDSRQVLSISVGNEFGGGIITQTTADLPHAFCISGLEESTTYYYRAFYEISSINELVYGEIKQFTTEGLFEINTITSPTEGGTVTGGGRYPANATVTLTATANNGYEFTHWNDGSVLSTRTIIVEGDATYTAYFEEEPPSLPDLSGSWTFNQTYFGDNHLILNMQLQSSTETSATYKSSWGSISITLTANIDGSMSIYCSGPYGYTGSFNGTFNSTFTVASGDSYYYGTPSWANPGWTVEDSWTFSR